MSPELIAISMNIRSDRRFPQPSLAAQRRRTVRHAVQRSGGV